MRDLIDVICNQKNEYRTEFISHFLVVGARQIPLRVRLLLDQTKALRLQ